MYEAFYGFARKPFSIVPEPEFLYPSRHHRIALDLMRHGLSHHAMFSAITGGIGTGKTMLVRYLLREIRADRRVGILVDIQPGSSDLLPWVLAAYQLDISGRTRIEQLRLFGAFLGREGQAGRRVVLIIDEAQNLSPSALEELRLLSNANVDGRELLQIVLLGQAGLRDALRSPGLRQLAQRIVVDYDLKPLARPETAEYIGHRVRRAGRLNGEIFDAGACRLVHEASDGVPRVINLVCDMALVYGYADQRPTIDAGTVQALLTDKEAAGGWLFAESAGSSPEPESSRIHAVPAPR
jgi:type II secretory pathway predicted ATPase ExeA